MHNTLDFLCGIDVGSNSVGMVAIAVDGSGLPTKILNSVVMIHDGGVDPEQAKAAVTRLASSGVARRTRRLIQRRRKRLDRLDRRIAKLGWPIVDLESSKDPYLPWNTRAQLVREKLEGDDLNRALSIAVRHMARHRGWRSPYASIESLFTEKPASAQMDTYKENVTKQSGVVFDEDATPAEVAVELGLNPSNRLRNAAGAKYGAKALIDGKSVSGQDKLGVLGGKLMQSDNAAELMKIGRVQGLSDELVKDLIRWVFESESPKSKAGERAGFDALPGQGRKHRAEKASLEFQEFRIVSVVANLRIGLEGGGSRLLSSDEIDRVVTFLMNDSGDDGVTWNDVAQVLGVSRGMLLGTASLSPEGERASSFPPSNTTNRAIYRSKIKELTSWWDAAEPEEKSAMVTALSNADELKEDAPGAEAVREFLGTLGEDQLGKLDDVSLPKGRAAYSADSLVRLTKVMRENHVDLHEARKIEFGVDNDWTPPADPIGKPVGNPAVDRVLKIVSRWLLAIEKKYGTPASINIEHVRSGFLSESSVREYERELKKHREQNLKLVAEMHANLGISGEVRSSDIRRYAAIRRQNCQCAYCGSVITYESSEMDHIVPRKGEGSTNTRDNLVAVCEPCNKAKSNTPFAVWAEHTTRPGVSLDGAIERVKFWIDEPGLGKKQNFNFRSDVIARLRRTSADEPLDSRSIESVAWMANELRDRVEAHFKPAGTKVRVFRGAITAAARKASGFEGKVELIGGNGKTRFDRRHHAMDASVIALMRQSVAQVLVERESKRQAAFLTSDHNSNWRDYRGSSTEAKINYGKWLNNMNRLVVLFNAALANDEIPVMQNLRLRLGNSTAHDATIRKFATKRVGDAWTRDEIDRASTPQMWVALSRDPDFSDTDGLPENPSRELRIKNIWYAANDDVKILPKKIAAIAVRGGWAEVGSSIHHARIYRFKGKGGKEAYGMIRVFTPDLVKHQTEDLFNVPLGPETLSMRDAKPAARDAVLRGNAEYLTWLTPGIELSSGQIKSSKPDAFGTFISRFPDTRRWVVTGFETNTIVNVKPRYLAVEGAQNLKLSDDIVKFLTRGWRPSIGVLTSLPDLRTVIRTTLGTPRQDSTHLPASKPISGD
ncbi:CRISPR-associated endonuclease Csn1 [Arcanobacterium wilhelmae]|uniref:CRISPR-associated endonuclease Csn1 n=1 Tax=Arcanobacterium wilhelmae TaxID=1803177 RepID=A0ABT9N9I0_9ACTO|nr:type II CRISPR RNA-guided endonuclease Cas9 [Arcanobacterium wilhelmae]MDP9800360.1 CRISPR-associated endonuclease Csn1 [Arcanobacterium wilhelmae]WFN89795.1 HNH endonuclease [Arcanobacterium wilhelmae]